MKIIAFDLGANFAWATNIQKVPMCFHDVFEGLRAHRQAKLLDRLDKLLNFGFGNSRYDLVVYETPFARGRDATRCGWGQAGIIEAVASKYNVPVVDVAVATIKKFATGDGRAPKTAMICAAQEFGFTVVNEHEADAACLLKYAELHAERVKK